MTNLAFTRCVTLCTLLLGPGSLFAGPPVTADKIKAGYLYQFTQFVTWPKLAGSDDAFRICVLGSDPISHELAPLHLSQIGGRQLRVNHPETIAEANSCNILYIADVEPTKLQSILAQLYKKPVLTVSSQADFASNGGVIGFTRDDDKIRLEINRTSAQNNNIKLNAKLLEVASLVVNDPQGEPAP